MDGLHRLALEDGIFMVAAVNKHRVGHCFVLQVQGDSRLVYDGAEVVPLLEYSTWIECVMSCVR